MKVHRSICCLTLIAAIASCTWVKPTAEGEKVKARTAVQVQQCAKLGTVKVSLKHKVARVERNAEKVEKELETLARNEAAVMGGDTVVPQSRVVEGRQEFGVYDCTP